MAASFSLLSTLYLYLEVDPNWRASLGIFCSILKLNSEKHEVSVYNKLDINL